LPDFSSNCANSILIVVVPAAEDFLLRKQADRNFSHDEASFAPVRKSPTPFGNKVFRDKLSHAGANPTTFKFATTTPAS
jgi:hypothetical protein